jgi:hypothetical protein
MGVRVTGRLMIVNRPWHPVERAMLKQTRSKNIFHAKREKKNGDARPLTINHLLLTKGQVILEFTFCMVIVLLMVYGITKILTWTGREYVGRITGHDETLFLSVPSRYSDSGPVRQIDPYYYTPVKLNAIWGED